MKKLFIVAAIAATSLLSACMSPSNSGSVYRAGQAQIEQNIRMAYVESVRNVTIDKGQTGVGTVAGAALGGIAAGKNIGGGSGAVAAGIVGAIAGGVIGQKIEGSVSQKPGYEITVRLDNGEIKAIVQDADESFRSGERVRLLTSGGTTRVSH
ncbi:MULTISPECIES: glycine zipper 2TM domain-containing protein [unclassified Undibacterium]|uniref:glycine zipper 2TM domain-containing protein n=1 Tax=unclassified Undibacterium TaxID=2630295 RepID=UPI002AC98D86|nr:MULTISPECIES: glycine zipper 2TM domain-containing protein [unclassified Undibacterium]MEB0138177.1 glycine zipper 2TM domain-containing protein [Undibacterium sp. CCC2.1]MEB0171068.1 glycine zipper 2TM domain-containing protein [Undibacterium sp. CCC1.1]MEB0175113.1 glycine zipper 2TM domain-containing protein [Undibacterium sp. CCC3.4]MEB0214303.1 glycine zipper 2TM domain-containing protein [Undibacterium sp. 5I2]WPX41883.1 glycine zipper 2TM domain-containing protein [Undibacterium sp. 